MSAGLRLAERAPPVSESALGHGRTMLQHLKEQTRREHEAIEQVVVVLQPAAGLADVRHYLEKLLGFHLPVEGAILSAGFEALPGLDLERRLKVPRLAADVLALGGSAETTPCPRIPDLKTPAQALGCLYVLEGATLGGQVVWRELRQRYPELERASAYLRCYGDQTGAMWRRFGAVLEGYVEEFGQKEAIVESALQTFVSLRQWLETGDPHAG